MLLSRIFILLSISVYFSIAKLSMFRSSLKIPVSLALYGGATHYSKPQMSTVCAAGKLNRGRSTPISLANKVVLITGATAGIGEACAWQFAEQGSRLILVGRREDRLNALKKDITSSYPKVEVHTVTLSVTDTDAVAALPKKLPERFRDVEILVNNAGLALGVSSVENNSIEDAKTVMDTNVIGTIALCRAFVPGMKERGAGHIINMGSVAGHHSYVSGSIYCASKYAVHAFTSSARFDLVGTPLRVTHISPGMVGGTEFSNVRFKDDAKATALYEGIEALSPIDVADNVLYAATRPAHVQIADIIMYATNQASPRDFVKLGPSMGGKQPAAK